MQEITNWIHMNIEKESSRNLVKAWQTLYSYICNKNGRGNNAYNKEL